MKINSLPSMSFGMIYKSGEKFPDDVKKKVVQIANSPKIYGSINPVAKKIQSYFPDGRVNRSITKIHPVINYGDYFLSGSQAIEYKELENKYKGDEFEKKFNKYVLNLGYLPALLNINYDKETHKIISAQLMSPPDTEK